MELNNIFLVLLQLVLAASYAHCSLNQRLCGSALVRFVSEVCGERGTYAGDSTHHLRKRSSDKLVDRRKLYSEKVSKTINAESNPFREESEAKSFLGLSRQKRRTGLIVRECCDNVCTFQIIESYCNPWPEETTTASATTATQTPEILPTEQREGNYLTDEVQMERMRQHEENSIGLLSEGSDFRDETPMPTERASGGRNHGMGHDQSADIDSGFHRFSDMGADVEESDSTIDNPASERHDPSSVRNESHEITTAGPHGHHHDGTGSNRRGGGRSSRRRNNERRKSSRRRNKRKRPKRSAALDDINEEDILKQQQRLNTKSQMIKADQPPNQNDGGVRRRMPIEELTKRHTSNKNGFSLQVSDLPKLRPRPNYSNSPTEVRSKKDENIKSQSYSIHNNQRNQRILSLLIDPRRRLRYRIIALTGVYNPHTSNHQSRRRLAGVGAKKEQESPTLPR